MVDRAKQDFIDKKVKHLEGKHRELDKIIAETERQEVNKESWATLRKLKKQKLALKDKLAGLKATQSELPD